MSAPPPPTRASGQEDARRRVHAVDRAPVPPNPAAIERPSAHAAQRHRTHAVSRIRAVRQRATLVSHVLVAGALLLVMHYGLLVGLLGLCVGFLATRALSRPVGRLLGGKDGWARAIAGTVVAIAPLVLLGLAVPRTRNLIFDAPTQYRELLAFLAQTVLELREKLPPDIAAQLPVGAADLQHVMATYLASKAGSLANAGRTWIVGLLLAFIGLLVGVLTATHKPVRRPRPLTAALRDRISHFGRVFTQIIVAQFWIALFNTCLTAIFLLVVMPLWQGRLPYTTALLVLTFVAGLIPIVGNLICNTVLTLVGLSVSLPVAVACLAFLIAIHKTEYFINAKVVGQRVHMGAWELLTVMFVMEAIFGAAGLVAAPLFYAYAKQELEASGWV
jgi:predicted PurR-regulated permease PerM